LFVEDHDDLRISTTEILKNFFETVDNAINGEEAISKYREFYEKNGKYYDIIISDIQMPKLNGVELTRNLYNINPNQIVVILSAYDDSRYLLPLINLGIERFVKKPIDYQDLLSVLLNAAKKINQSTDNLIPKNTQEIDLDRNFKFNRGDNTLYNGKEFIYMTKYEIIFLNLLTKEVGKIYSNEEIAQYYKLKGESLDSANIRKLVSKLRKKLPQNTIESIYGIGYRVVPFLD